MADTVRGSADARPNLPITTIGFHGADLIVRAGEPRAMSAPLPHIRERAAPGEALQIGRRAGGCRYHHHGDTCGQDGVTSRREVLPDGALALVSDGYRIVRGGAAR